MNGGEVEAPGSFAEQDTKKGTNGGGRSQVMGMLFKVGITGHLLCPSQDQKEGY